MNEIPKEMYEVHGILDRYISIHDDIFKPSIRKIIPIPGIFKKIDYNKHHHKLSDIVEELESIDTSLKSNQNTPDIFQQYVSSLLYTVVFLNKMCEKLARVGSGALNDYAKDEYQRDVDEYQSLVENYKKIGLEVNQHIRGG